MMQTQASTVIAEETKYCLYARKSTESDERQALSIDSQIKEMMVLAQREGIEIIDILRESHSAKETGQRPVFNEMIAGIRNGTYNSILTWAPDRLSRNAGDLGSIVDMMDQKKIIEIRTYGQKFSNNPNEKFLLMILGSQAKLENDNKGVNVKRGLRTRCEMGMWPSRAPTGYLNNPNRMKKCDPVLDPERAPVIREIFERVVYQGISGRQMYAWLKFEKDFRASSGKHLSLSNIYTILNNHFYYGSFEYPKKSGNWYQGAHTPLISKELFDEAQKCLKERYNSAVTGKEFAFTRLLTCGKCGSGISANEKYKKLINGSFNKHIYYACTKSRDKSCSNSINETNLISELIKIIDQIDMNELGIYERVKHELKRYGNFQAHVLGNNEKQKKVDVSEIDIKNYAKYILKEGMLAEKRELLKNFKNKIILEDEILRIS
ncbi:MAG: recombinase family protein [Patescibacteria group bacterium]